MLKVERISFGFPQNMKLEISLDELDDIKKKDFTNKNVDLHIEIDRLLKKNFNKEKIEKEIQEATNASKVRISFYYNTQDISRSKEIAEQKDIIDKVKAYASLNGISYKESALDKIRDIQDNIMMETFTPHDSFTLEYMSLRGAIGIMEGQGKEEISFDFANDFEEGIIGITGVSGSGKTTLLENMHPYPCMLTRPLPLKEHFCLSDSHRILIYRNNSGKKYKITMNINGTAKNVMTEYLVETKEGEEHWKPVTSVNGSADAYKKWVNATFGPKELFMRTAFYAKELPKDLPDLAQATKGEKMELFSVLAGLDYLSIFADKAKERIKVCEDSIEDIQGQLKDYDNIEQKIEDSRKSLEENNNKIEENTKQINEDSTILDEYNNKQQEYIKMSATYDIYRRQLNEKRHECEETKKSLIQHQNNVTAYEQQMEDIETYKSQIEWWDDNMKHRKELLIEDSKIRDSFNSLQARIDKKQSKIDAHKDKLNEYKSQFQNTVFNIEHYTKSIPDINGVCPVCGAPLETHKKEQLEQEAENIKSQIKTLEQKKSELNDSINEENKWLENNSIQNYKSELTDLNKQLVSISNEITSIDSYVETIDIDEAKDIVNNCSSKLEKEQEYVNEYQNKFDTLQKEITETEEYLNNIPEDYSDKINRIQRGIDIAKQEISEAVAMNKIIEQNLSYYAKAEEQIKEIKEKTKVYKADIKDYEFIQLAFGKTGIQIYELDSAAPEISDIANAILLETYGDRFTISFETERESKDKRKIDDFIIMVFDAKSGRNKRLDLISSGEGTLIKQTLYYAFSVIRTRRTGFCFRTRFLDESDSSLDSSLRVKYLRMIEAAHKQCFAVQSFLITHSQEVKDIVEQKIEL